MACRTCFVIMPIGDQELDGNVVSASDLKKRYDDLIKEALLKADPQLDVVRADEVATPGTITSDILTRIMHSDLVVADVTFPNANVFYELGLRHACRVGTIIIKDKDGPGVPFDIAHLRHIPYENTPTGLKQLADDFAGYLNHFAQNPDRPDSLFQELAKLVGYSFPDYGDDNADADPETKALMAVMKSPEVLELLVRQASGEELDETELLSTMLKTPDVAGLMVKAMLQSGQVSLTGSATSGGQRPSRKKSKPRKKRKNRKSKG